MKIIRNHAVNAWLAARFDADKYIDQILASFKKKTKHIPDETLSLREEEILQYFEEEELDLLDILEDESFI